MGVTDYGDTRATQPVPVLPDYGRANISGIVPTLFGPHGTHEIPDWMPSCLKGARAVVLLVLDGLGWLQFDAHRMCMPTLSSFQGGAITTVVPSTTATALTSLATGLAPAEHGLVGYRIDMGDTVMNTLRWGDESDDLRRRYPPQQVQSCPPFLGASVPVLSKAELAGSGFTQAHLSGVRHHDWRASSSIAVTTTQLINAGETFVYAYYDGIDKIAHERGFGDFYDAELRAADTLVADILAGLPSDVALLVTADHGQVHVGANTIILSPAIMRHVHHQSGEGRFRWLHARRLSASALLDLCFEAYGDVAWVVSRSQVLDEGWFGPTMSTEIQRRLGDVALVPFADVSFEDPADGGAFQLICRHGSLTEAEMRVPLLCHVGK
ncbi:MAG: PglZ domain-containing protein [Ilumatobacteraceae bacterium]|nr:PglZ domain-containing protein [Ilumatobacteraceae bacterium]